MTTGRSPMCLSCRHFNRGSIVEPTCAAFPKGIPESIYYEAALHKQPIEGQKNDIVYEPVFKAPK